MPLIRCHFLEFTTIYGALVIFHATNFTTDLSNSILNWRCSSSSHHSGMWGLKGGLARGGSSLLIRRGQRRAGRRFSSIRSDSFQLNTSLSFDPICKYFKTYRTLRDALLSPVSEPLSTQFRTQALEDTFLSHLPIKGQVGVGRTLHQSFV